MHCQGYGCAWEQKHKLGPHANTNTPEVDAPASAEFCTRCNMSSAPVSSRPPPSASSKCRVSPNPSEWFRLKLPDRAAATGDDPPDGSSLPRMRPGIGLLMWRSLR